MQEGLYESLLTQQLQRDLEQAQRSDQVESVLARIDEAEQPEVLARHVRDATQRALASTRDPLRRVRIVNAILDQLDAVDDGVPEDPQQLLSLTRPDAPGRIALGAIRPRTPLSDAALLTNSHGEPTLGAELRAELDTADEVDLLCAFVK